MLNLKQISFQYGNHEVLKNLDLQIAQGELYALLGSSGCGKSTLLKVITGLLQAEGQVELAQQPLIFGKDKVEKRDVGYVFQDGALFPHFTVEKNILYGLSKVSSSEKKARIQEAIEALHIQDTLQRYPHEISGGQQQRVAIARALVRKPKLLLMDEPFSSLDAQIKSQLVVDIRHVLKEAGVTTLLVTHDQKEAFAMADKIGVMHRGQILQEGPPHDVYDKPQSEFIAHFVGKGKSVSGSSLNGLVNNSSPPDRYFIRPEWIFPSQDDEGFNAKPIHKVYLGAYYEFELELDCGQKLIWHTHFIPEQVQLNRNTKWKLNHPPVNLPKS